MNRDEIYEAWLRERAARRPLEDPSFHDDVMREARRIAERRHRRFALVDWPGRSRGARSGTGTWLVTGAGALAGAARLFLIAALVLGTA